MLKIMIQCNSFNLTIQTLTTIAQVKFAAMDVSYRYLANFS